MGHEKKEDQKKPPVASDAEAASGPQEKGVGDDLKVMMAQLQARTQGLEPHEIEEEIDRFMEKMIARHAKVVPEKLRAEHRQLLLNMLADDPTLRALRDDLRKNLLKGG